MTVRAYMKNPLIILLLMIAAALSVGCGDSGVEGYYSYHAHHLKPMDPNEPNREFYYLKSNNKLGYYALSGDRLVGEDWTWTLVFDYFEEWQLNENQLILSYEGEFAQDIKIINLLDMKCISWSSDSREILDDVPRVERPMLTKISKKLFLETIPSELKKKIRIGECNTCDRKISVNAKACPNCEEPNPAK